MRSAIVRSRGHYVERQCKQVIIVQTLYPKRLFYKLYKGSLETKYCENARVYSIFKTTLLCTNSKKMHALNSPNEQKTTLKPYKCYHLNTFEYLT